MVGIVISIVASIAGGYLAIAVWSLISTMFIGAASPAFVAKQSHMQTTYILTESALWVIGCAIGGYITAVLSTGMFRYLTLASLLVLIVTIVWRNAVELKPPTPPIVISVITVAGIVSGALLVLKQ